METLRRRQTTIPSAADLLHKALCLLQNPEEEDDYDFNVEYGMNQLADVYRKEYDALEPLSAERQLLCEELGFCYYYGIGCEERWPDTALKIWRRGAAEGSKYCQAQMPELEPDEASRLFAELAVEQNHRLALSAHGFRQQSPEQAQLFYRRGIEQRNPVAMYNMYLQTNDASYERQALLYGFSPFFGTSTRMIAFMADETSGRRAIEKEAFLTQFRRRKEEEPSVQVPVKRNRDATATSLSPGEE